MKYRYLILVVFVLVAFLQLWVPTKMIYDKNEIITKGKEFKFKVAPFDPSDPFRGKYITLYFDENKCTIRNKKAWKRNDEIFAHLTVDVDGMARISAISKSRPTDIDYIKVKISQVSKDLVYLDFPFDHFYIDENKAKTKVYEKPFQDQLEVFYAKVKIKDGETALLDVFVNGTSANLFSKKKKL